MSHFKCAVITDGTKTVGELLAPYQENNMETVPQEYLSFTDETEQYVKEYESKPFVYYRDPESIELFWQYDDRFKNPDVFAEPKYIYPSRYTKVEVPRSVVYPTFEEYMSDFYEMEPHEGRYGYWENPNARWDWYNEISSPCWADDYIGGAPIRIRDIRFDPERGVAVAREFIRAHPGGDKGIHDLERYWTMRDMTDEQFIESSRHISFWACITPDGEWHEGTEMLMFGVSEEASGDDIFKWRTEFKGRFLDPYQDCTLHVIDCHI